LLFNTLFKRTRQSLLKQEQEWLRNNNNKGPRFWQVKYPPILNLSHWNFS
jgi:hypothetical protein